MVPALLTLMWVILGCGASGESGGSLPPEAEDPPVFPDSGPASIAFRAPAGLTMIAGQPAEVEVQVLPPGEHTVRFALLGKTDGAFLSESVVVTEPDGTAATTLTALAAASNFSVRAAASTLSATLDVVTLEASQASLVVTPNYPGSRSVASWVASVHLDTTCAELEGVPFPDGQLASTASGETVRIDGIPAEVPLAVVVRAGRFAGGCRSVPTLRASSVTPIQVEVTNRPLQTEALSLRLELGVEPTEVPNPALDELAFRAVSPLTGGANDDLAALLDAMSGLSANPLAFEQARAAQGWRAALVNGLAADLPGTGLRTLVQDWMRSGLELLEAPRALQGTLTSPGAAGSASLELDSVIGLTPEETGFEPINAATAVAETEDFLRIGTTLSWRPSPFLAAAANRAALANDPERTGAADAMATRFGCGNVAGILVGVGSVPGEAFAGCDGECAEALCRDAMEVLWARVGGSELPAVPWQITGASRATIDEDARPIEVIGTWIGTLTLPDFQATPIGGPFSGEASP